jgi:hypothetical protein
MFYTDKEIKEIQERAEEVCSGVATRLCADWIELQATLETVRGDNFYSPDHVDERDRLKENNNRLRRVILDLTQKRDWENWILSDEAEAVMRELYPFSELADKKEPLFPKCMEFCGGGDERCGEHPPCVDAQQEHDRKEWQQMTDELRHGG